MVTFQVMFEGISLQEATEAVKACVRELKGESDNTNPDESKLAKLGADLLGFIDGCASIAQG